MDDPYLTSWWIESIWCIIISKIKTPNYKSTPFYTDNQFLPLLSPFKLVHQCPTLATKKPLANLPPTWRSASSTASGGKFWPVRFRFHSRTTRPRSGGFPVPPPLLPPSPPTNYGCAAAAAAAGWLVLPERGQLSRLWRSPWRTFSRSPDAVDVAFVVRPDDKTHARSHAHFDVSLGGRRPSLGHCTGLGSLCRIAGGHSGPCWVSFCWTHARFPHAIYYTNVVIWFLSPRETLTLQ